MSDFYTIDEEGIEELIKLGTSHEKIIALVNHAAELDMGTGGFLSDEQYQSLLDSLYTYEDRKKCQSFMEALRPMQLYLSTVAQLRAIHRASLNILDKLFLLKYTNLDLEEAFNKLLEIIPEDKKEQAFAIAEKFKFEALNRKIKKKNGFVYIESHADERIEAYREKIAHDQRRLKAAIQVVKEYIKKNQFNINIYNSYIKATEKWLKSKKDDELLMQRANDLKYIPKNKKDQWPTLLEPDYKLAKVTKELREYFWRMLK